MTYPGHYCLRHCGKLSASKAETLIHLWSVCFLNDATKQSLWLLLPSAAVARLLS